MPRVRARVVLLGELLSYRTPQPFEIALVFVRFDHVATFILNANRGFI